MGDKLKHVRQSGFTVLPNDILFDENLSLGALGLLGRMMALPEDWEFSVAGLAGMCRCGKDHIRTCLNQVQKAGYLLREQERGEDGKYCNTYILYDSPQVHRVGLSDADNPCRETRRNINTKNTNIPPIVPQGGQSDEGAPKWKPERFAAFWEAYPKKQAKGKAVRAWDKLKADDRALDAMARGLKRWLRSDQWERGIIPLPSTWLNQRRWEDEDIEAGRGGGVLSEHREEAYGWQ